MLEGRAYYGAAPCRPRFQPRHKDRWAKCYLAAAGALALHRANARAGSCPPYSPPRIAKRDVACPRKPVSACLITRRRILRGAHLEDSLQTHLKLAFLIDRGYQLEIDVTNLESARSIFLIVAELRFSLFAALTKLSAQQRSFSRATRIERNADSSQEIFFSGLEEERRAEDQRDCGELREQQRGRCRRPLDARSLHAFGDAGDVRHPIADEIQSDVSHQDRADRPALRFADQRHGDDEASAHQDFDGHKRGERDEAHALPGRV